MFDLRAEISHWPKFSWKKLLKKEVKGLKFKLKGFF